MFVLDSLVDMNNHRLHLIHSLITWSDIFTGGQAPQQVVIPQQSLPMSVPGMPPGMAHMGNFMNQQQIMQMLDPLQQVIQGHFLNKMSSFQHQLSLNVIILIVNFATYNDLTYI